VDGEYRFLRTGYDPQYAKYSIGAETFYRAIEWACESDTVQILDLAEKSSVLKRHLANDSYDTVALYVFRKSLRNLLIVLGHYAFGRAAGLSKLALAKTGLGDRLRKRLRRR
jgi:CelD/BcsL family acetyltransferase involved in cellulose biosynthesis